MRSVLSILFALLLPFCLAAEEIEVIVTASRVEEETEKVPAMVSVITAEELAASGRTTLVEALDGLAGVHFRSYSGNAAQAEVSMRGFGENSHGRVLVLVDGRKLNRPDMAPINWLQIPLENVERVEVVRGGNSVLYGDHAVAGVINIITKQGSEDLDVTASLQIGSLGADRWLNQERAGVSGSTGAFSFSANAEHTDSDGYRDRSAYRSIGAGAYLGFELSEAWAVGLDLAFDKLDFQMPGSLTRAAFEADPRQAANPADEARQQYLNADLDVSADWTETRRFRANLVYGLKAIETDFTTPWPLFSDQVMHTLAFTPRLDLGLDLFGQENRTVMGFDGYLDLFDVTQYGEQERLNETTVIRVTKLAGGLYLKDEISLGESFLLSAGLRYDLARFAAEVLTGVPFEGEKLHQELAYEAGLVFRPVEQARAYARYNRVFRYPFTDEQANVYGFGGDVFLADLEAERGHNLEVGAEAEVVDGLRLSLNGFLLDMEGEIAYVGVFPTGSNQNIDDTRRLGFEAALDAQPSPWLQVEGSYSYTRAVFRNGTNEGNQVPLVPAHQATGRLELLLPYGLSLAGAARFQGESFQGGDFSNSQPAIEPFWTTDLSLHFRPRSIPGNLDLMVAAENLLDRQYAPYVSFGGYYPAPGRTFKVGDRTGTRRGGWGPGGTRPPSWPRWRCTPGWGWGWSGSPARGCGLCRPRPRGHRCWCASPRRPPRHPAVRARVEAGAASSPRGPRGPRPAAGGPCSPRRPALAREPPPPAGRGACPGSAAPAAAADGGAASRRRRDSGGRSGYTRSSGGPATGRAAGGGAPAGPPRRAGQRRARRRGGGTAPRGAAAAAPRDPPGLPPLRPPRRGGGDGAGAGAGQPRGAGRGVPAGKLQRQRRAGPGRAAGGARRPLRAGAAAGRRGGRGGDRDGALPAHRQAKGAGMIVIVGAAAIDLVAMRAESYRAGTSNPARVRLAPGGVGARLYRALGGPRRLVTALGDDPLSDWLAGELGKEGGEAEARVQRAAGFPAPAYLALMEAGRLHCGASDMRAVEQGLTEAFVGEALADLGSGDLLVLEANLAPSLAAGLIGRHAGGTRLVFETVSVEKAARHAAALRGLFLLSTNEEEAAVLVGGLPAAETTVSVSPGVLEDPALLRFQAERRIELLLVTRGARGVSLYRGGRRRDFPPQRVVAAEDTTGAGDRLLAGLLAGLAAGREAEEVLPEAMRGVERALEEGSL